jgi:hypothetical protein
MDASILVWVTIPNYVLLQIFTDLSFFNHLVYIAFLDVHTNYTRYDIEYDLLFGFT